MPSNANILIQTPELCTAHCEQICVVIPRATPDLPMLRRIRESLQALGARNEQMGVLFVVGEKAPAPTGPVRDAAGALFDDVLNELKVVSANVEGSGFMASAKRSVFTWVTSRILRKAPVKTYAKLSEAADWLEIKCKELGIACPSSHELQALVEQMLRDPERQFKSP